MVFVLGHVEDVALLHRAMEHDVLLFVREVFVGHVDANVHSLSHLGHERPHEVAPRTNSAFLEGEVRVGDERGFVDSADHARASAFGAGSTAIECQVLRAGAVELDPAYAAGDGALDGNIQARRILMSVGATMACQAGEHEAQVIQQFGGGAEGGVHARDARPLAEGQGGGHVEHFVYIRAACLGDATAGIGGKRF